MSVLRPDGGASTEVEALITDRYLDTLLAAQPRPIGESIEDESASLSAAVRAVSRRLALDLPRFHPSFRFEERLALRLAQIAASMRLPVAARAEGHAVVIPAIPVIPVAPGTVDRLAHDGAPLDLDAPFDPHADNRPLLIGGAVAASAISLAGAWLAWRRRTSPIARAVRAAHDIRHAAGHGS